MWLAWWMLLNWQQHRGVSAMGTNCDRGEGVPELHREAEEAVPVQPRAALQVKVGKLKKRAGDWRGKQEPTESAAHET